MLKLLFGCIVSALIGASIILLAPRFAVIGLALIAIPAVLSLQAVLLAIVNKFAKTERSTDPGDVPQNKSELSALLWAYRDLKLFLARAAGYVGLVFGIVTANWYYIGLSTALIILFWTLDRMHVPQGEQAELTEAQRVSGLFERDE